MNLQVIFHSRILAFLGQLKMFAPEKPWFIITQFSRIPGDRSPAVK